MNKIILPLIVVCWIFAAALAICLPAYASITTSSHATLINKPFKCATTINSNSQLSTVVNIVKPFQTTADRDNFKRTLARESKLDKTNGYDIYDHYNKINKRDGVTIIKTQVTPSPCR